jgi:hypothetical protein
VKRRCDRPDDLAAFETDVLSQFGLGAPARSGRAGRGLLIPTFVPGLPVIWPLATGMSGGHEHGGKPSVSGGAHAGGRALIPPEIGFSR